MPNLAGGRPAPLITRCLVSGTLMGLANLVPGISGGTMLLAAGVYPLFVEGVAEITTLRFRARTLLGLGSIGLAAVFAIVLLAGVVRNLVLDHRWAMYSLFIGLTLGGVPVVWKLLRRPSVPAVAGCLAGVAVMGWMAIVEPGAGGAGDPAYLLLFFAGLAGASAMILPGVSGGYLLLVLGQYIPILTAIDEAKIGLQTADWSRIAAAMHVFIPVGIGVGLGIVGVSNLIKLLLERQREATLGVLLGLLLGAVLGLWPFQHAVPPAPGNVVRGQVMTPALIAELDPRYYPLQRYAPTAGTSAAAAGFAIAGFLVTLAVARLGVSETER